MEDRPFSFKMAWHTRVLHKNCLGSECVKGKFCTYDLCLKEIPTLTEERVSIGVIAHKLV